MTTAPSYHASLIFSFYVALRLHFTLPFYFFTGSNRPCLSVHQFLSYGQRESFVFYSYCRHQGEGLCELDPVVQ